MIEVTNYYELDSGPLRFYLADEMKVTRSVKSSPGGLRGRTYLDLQKLTANYNPKANYTGQQLAPILEDTLWK